MNECQRGSEYAPRDVEPRWQYCGSATSRTAEWWYRTSMPTTDPRAHALPLVLLPDAVALCRLEPTAPFPDWMAHARQFLTLSRTPTELSIIADDAAVPDDVTPQRGYRVLRVDGPLPLDLVGIFASLATPLAQARIPILPIATYDTDYLLVHERDILRAVHALTDAGHRVR